MRKTALWAGAAVLGLASGLFAYEFAFAAGGRADCPGKIVCPLTGELVCSDQCPLGAGSAAPEKAAVCCQEGR